MNKTLIKVATALFTVAIATTSFAGKGEKPAMGKVTAVTDSSITVNNKKTGEKTFKISPDTKFAKVDGTAGAASDIKVGSMVKITAGATPDAAATISAYEHKKKEGAAATGSESKPAAE